MTPVGILDKEKLSYTTKEATKATGIYRQLLYLYRDEGLLNPVKIGRTYIWVKADLERFLNWAQGLNLSSHDMIAIAKLKKPLKNGK